MKEDEFLEVLRDTTNIKTPNFNEEIVQMPSFKNSGFKSLWDLSTEIIRGNYGNGKERQQKLTEEGYNYHQVQDFVNKRLYGTLTDDDYSREYINTPVQEEMVEETITEDTPVEVPKAPNFSSGGGTFQNKGTAQPVGIIEFLRSLFN